MMRSYPIVLPEPDIDCDLRLSCAVEPLCIQNLPSQCSVEAFIVSVLPRAPRVDLHRPDADLFQPVLQMSGYELRAVVRTYELRLSMLHEKPVQRIQNIVCVHSGAHRHAERFAGILIQNCQHFIAAPIAEFVMNKVYRPDVVPVCGRGRETEHGGHLFGLGVSRWLCQTNCLEAGRVVPLSLHNEDDQPHECTLALVEWGIIHSTFLGRLLFGCNA